MRSPGARMRHSADGTSGNGAEWVLVSAGVYDMLLNVSSKGGSAMRRTRQTSAVHIPVMAVLSAVLYGCAFLVPAAGSAATITVEIIKPDKDPYRFETGKEYEFEAVAFVDGVELPGGEVCWEWDFGDETEHLFVNPARHTFAHSGNFVVKATARYGSLTGQDTINAAAAAGQLLAAVDFAAMPTPYSVGCELGDQVCDGVWVAWSIPEMDLTMSNAVIGDVKIYRRNGEDWIECPAWRYYWYSDFLGEGFWVVSTLWETTDGPNTEAVDWRVDYNFWVNEPPPPGEEGPYYVSVKDSMPASWTPYNTVLTGDTEPIIKHALGDESHTISWSIAHLRDPAAGIDPKYHVEVKILDLAGNEVATVTKDEVAIGDGSVEWVPTFTPPGEDPPDPGQTVDQTTIFTYKITADHGMCCDTWPSSGTASEVSGAPFVTGSPAPGDLEIEVDYEFSRDAGSGDVDVYKIGADGVTKVGHTALTGDYLRRGPHTSPRFTVRATPDDPLIAIVRGDETTEDGDLNRGGEAKPVRPGGSCAGTVRCRLRIMLPTEAADHNKPFNEQTPFGVCNIEANGTCGVSSLNAQLHWELSEIEGSVLTSNPDTHTGPVVNYMYTGLPSANGAFGRKLLVLTHPRAEAPATRGIDIFFDRDAFNHPNQGDPRTPNWYYYWSQTSASTGNHRYFADPIDPHTYGLYFAGDTYFYICPLAHVSIDVFARTCIHENAHRSLYFDHWPGGYKALDDLDGDRLRDTLEAGMGYDRELKKTHPDGPGSTDAEHYCETEAMKWIAGSAKSEDWAWPGSQNSE